MGVLPTVTKTVKCQPLSATSAATPTTTATTTGNQNLRQTGKRPTSLVTVRQVTQATLGPSTTPSQTTHPSQHSPSIIYSILYCYIDYILYKSSLKQCPNKHNYTEK